MVTIALPPDLEDAVRKRAEQQGTTPELMALNSLRNEYLAVRDIPDDSSETMADFLGDFIGCFDSRKLSPRPEPVAERTGEAFKQILLKKRRDGKV